MPPHLGNDATSDPLTYQPGPLVVGRTSRSLTALATWGATSWLLSVAGQSADLRVEAIKAGLTVAAGTGGAAALLLAARRQWLQERDQSHREETDAANQAHQQRLAAITELDATERRITDLYTKAVDQLGSEKAPVRLGGLYALERLAQDNPNHRQTIVNVICAYLRMPFAPVGVDVRALSPSPYNAREELQVRLTAQRILATHLNPLADSQIESDEVSKETVNSGPLASNTRKFWDAISIDLSGAVLINLDFSGCTIDRMECREAQFLDSASFARTKFIHGANFAAAVFSHDDEDYLVADFAGAIFDGNAVFDDATFAGVALFFCAKFNDEALLSAKFKQVDFEKARFRGWAWFAAAKFTGKATFNEAVFDAPATFEKATFTQGSPPRVAYFHGTVFSEKPNFEGATVINVTKKQRIYGEAWPDGWIVEYGEDNIGRLAHRPEDLGGLNETREP